MPRKATVLNIFVASPSDVSEERNCLDSVVSRVNSSFAKTCVRLELIRWEQDASPALGGDAQTVISDQLPTDYDVFVGIMWNTVGTQTGRAESGTIEEFERALERFEQDPESVRVMLYFKDSVPLSMGDIDPEQLKKVREFRSRIESKGLYHVFNDTNDFANAVHVHLTKLVMDHLPQEGGRVSPQSLADAQDVNAHEEEEGLLELEETLEAEMNALSGVVHRMEEAIADIGAQFHRRTRNFELINAQPTSANSQQSLRGDLKRLLGHSSRDMDRFVSAMQNELPLYRQHLDRGIGSLVRFIPLRIQFGADEGEMAAQVRGLMNTMDSMMESIQGFKDSVHELLPLTSPLVRSKRAIERVLQQTIEITQDGRAMLEGVLGLLD